MPTDTATATVVSNPYGDYSPGDTGNWSDLGPWFGLLILSAVLVPYAFKTLMGAVHRIFGMA